MAPLFNERDVKVEFVKVKEIFDIMNNQFELVRLINSNRKWHVGIGNAYTFDNYTLI